MSPEVVEQYVALLNEALKVEVKDYIVGAGGELSGSSKTLQKTKFTLTPHPSGLGFIAHAHDIRGKRFFVPWTQITSIELPAQPKPRTKAELKAAAPKPAVSAAPLPSPEELEALAEARRQFAEKNRGDAVIYDSNGRPVAGKPESEEPEPDFDDEAFAGED